MLKQIEIIQYSSNQCYEIGPYNTLMKGRACVRGLGNRQPL
jgi:hypothetical protein